RPTCSSSNQTTTANASYAVPTPTISSNASSAQRVTSQTTRPRMLSYAHGAPTAYVGSGLPTSAAPTTPPGWPYVVCLPTSKPPKPTLLKYILVSYHQAWA